MSATLDKRPAPSSDSTQKKMLERLRALGPPKPLLVGPAGRPPSTEDLAQRRFKVGDSHVRLPPPVDWHQDPYDSRSWRYELHTLTWLKPLLLAHANSSNSEALEVALDLELDWARTHADDMEHLSEFAWYDMAVGLRAPYLAYVLRASLMAAIIQDDQAELLIRVAARHGAELAEDANYAAGHNHGLFQDEGLYLLAQQLPTLPSTSEWRELALNRLRTTLKRTINFEEGAHLEHSSAYQFSITGLVSRLAENISDMPELAELRDHMRETCAWHVTSAGRLSQLGDTDDVPAPKWARRAAAEQHGLKALFDTGQAFVRQGDSYLAVTAGYHSSAHKHADDTGFILVENGVTVVGDAGRWGYYEDEPDRKYARSAKAHNVLTVDGEDFAWRRSKPYGSGLEVAATNTGWHAIVVRNLLLRQQGVDHWRTLLYRPGVGLLLLDNVRAAEEHDYARHFHFSSELSAELTGNRIALHGSDLTATLTDCDPGGTVELARGQRSPSLSGWTYPADRERHKTFTATLRRRVRAASFAAALGIGHNHIEVTSLEAEPARFLLSWNGRPTLEVVGTNPPAVISRLRDESPGRN